MHWIICDIRVWFEQKQGETGYYATHILLASGSCHMPNCPVSDLISKDAERVKFHCPSFAVERRILNQAQKRSVSSEHTSTFAGMLRLKEI